MKLFVPLEHDVQKDVNSLVLFSMRDLLAELESVIRLRRQLMNITACTSHDGKHPVSAYFVSYPRPLQSVFGLAAQPS